MPSITCVIGYADTGYAAELEVTPSCLGVGPTMEAAVRQAVERYVQRQQTHPDLQFWVPDDLQPQFNREFPLWNFTAWQVR